MLVERKSWRGQRASWSNDTRTFQNDNTGCRFEALFEEGINVNNVFNSVKKVAGDSVENLNFKSNSGIILGLEIILRRSPTQIYALSFVG